MTGGRGRFTARHSHYDPVPAHLADRIATARPAQLTRQDGTDAPSDCDQSSGFCSVYSPEHAAVDCVEFHESADARRFVGAVEQDAPRRAAASPRQASCADAWPTGKPTVRLATRERIGLVDPKG